MIPYFPTLYEDELFYSGLCRYYCHTGYTSYLSARKDIYAEKNIKPDMGIINALSSEMLYAVTRQYSMEDLIQKHTMYPYIVIFSSS